MKESNNNKLLDIFYKDCSERCEKLTGVLEDILNDKDSSPKNYRILRAVKNEFHVVKGGASFVKIREIEDLAKQAEYISNNLHTKDNWKDDLTKLKELNSRIMMLLAGFTQER